MTHPNNSPESYKLLSVQEFAQSQRCIEILKTASDRLQAMKRLVKEYNECSFIGRISCAIMKLVRGYVFTGKPPPVYGCETSAKSCTKMVSSLTKDQAQKWEEAIQVIQSKLPFKDYVMTDNCLRDQYGVSHSLMGDRRPVSGHDLYQAASQIPEPNFRSDVMALVRILEHCTTEDQPLEPNLPFQDCMVFYLPSTYCTRSEFAYLKLVVVSVCSFCQMQHA